MNPFDTYLLDTVTKLSGRARRPVKTGRIVGELGHIPYATIRYYLNRLEQMGKISRPKPGKGRRVSKGGWLVN